MGDGSETKIDNLVKRVTVMEIAQARALETAKSHSEKLDLVLDTTIWIKDNVVDLKISTSNTEQTVQLNKKAIDQHVLDIQGLRDVARDNRFARKAGVAIAGVVLVAVVTLLVNTP